MEVIETKLNKPLGMTEKDSGYFNYSTKYWICWKEHAAYEVKVKDHDHITGEYWGSAHLNLSLSKKNVLCLIIFKIMTHILTFKNGSQELTYQWFQHISASSSPLH